MVKYNLLIPQFFILSLMYFDRGFSSHRGVKAKQNIRWKTGMILTTFYNIALASSSFRVDV